MIFNRLKDSDCEEMMYFCTTFPKNCTQPSKCIIMNKNILVKFVPHIAAILLFICISFLYFSPVLEGKQLLGHDTESWMYMAKETLDFNSTHDEPTLWTNSMFGGMPTFQITMLQPNNVIKYLENIIHFFPNTVYNLILYLIGFYILLLSFKVPVDTRNLDYQIYFDKGQDSTTHLEPYTSSNTKQLSLQETIELISSLPEFIKYKKAVAQ